MFAVQIMDDEIDYKKVYYSIKSKMEVLNMLSRKNLLYVLITALLNSFATGKYLVETGFTWYKD